MQTTIRMAAGIALPEPTFNLSQSIWSGYNLFSFWFWLFRFIPFIALIVLYLQRRKIVIQEKAWIFSLSIFSALVFR